MNKIVIEQSGSFRTAGEDISKGEVQIAVVEIEGNCHVVVSKDLEAAVQSTEQFIKSGPTGSYPTFLAEGNASSIIEKLSELFSTETLPSIGGSRIYLGGKIVVRRRSDDYMAFVSDNLGKWEAGESIPVAIGKLVKNQMS